MRLVGDGRLGHPADGPYNAIHVGAAAETLPETVSISGEPPVRCLRKKGIDASCIPLFTTSTVREYVSLSSCFKRL